MHLIFKFLIFSLSFVGFPGLIFGLFKRIHSHRASPDNGEAEIRKKPKTKDSSSGRRVKNFIFLFLIYLVLCLTLLEFFRMKHHPDKATRGVRTKNSRIKILTIFNRLFCRNIFQQRLHSDEAKKGVQTKIVVLSFKESSRGRNCSSQL